MPIVAPKVKVVRVGNLVAPSIGSGVLAPVVVATTGNIDLATGGIPDPSLTDSVTVEVGERILVWQQDDITQIGVYIVQVGSWTRAPDVPSMYDDGQGGFINGSPVDGIFVATGSEGSAFSGQLFNFIAENAQFLPVPGAAVLTNFSYTMSGPDVLNMQIAISAGDVTSSRFNGPGDGIVFPDSDPHVAGAAYWVGGVLTKSAG